jgi:predicted DNA-binding protein
MTKKIHIVLSEEQHHILKMLSKRTSVSMSAIVKMQCADLFNQYITPEEDTQGLEKT